MIAKYSAVQCDLSRRIQDGEYAPGDAIPSERQLTEYYAVSRITIRRAISELIARGRLVTIQGKGTFVSHTNAGLDLMPLTSCTEDITRIGLVPSKKVIERKIVKAGEQSSCLSLTNDDDVYRLCRVYYGNGEPINYTETHLNAALFPGIESYNFEIESLYDVLRRDYALSLSHARRMISASFPTERVSKLLNVDRNTPVLFFRCVTQGSLHGREVIFEDYSSWYRSDRYAFYIDQKRQMEGGDLGQIAHSSQFK